MKRLDDFLKQADERMLKIMGLTGSSTGYPSPELGYFVSGFRDFSAVKEFSREQGGAVCGAEWRDGWGYAYFQGKTYKPFDVNSILSRYGDDFGLLETKIEKGDMAHFIGYESMGEAREWESEAYIADYIVNFDLLIDELDELVDWDGGDFAIIDKTNLRFERSVPGEPVNHYHDTRHSAIGVGWLWDDQDTY